MIIAQSLSVHPLSKLSNRFGRREGVSETAAQEACSYENQVSSVKIPDRRKTSQESSFVRWRKYTSY